MDQQESDPPPYRTAPRAWLRQDETDENAIVPETEEAMAPKSGVLSDTETENENQTSSDQQQLVSQSIALALKAQESVHKLEETVRSLKHTQQQRFEEVEGQIQACEGALLSQIAELETRVQQAAQETVTSAAHNIGALVTRIEAAEGARREADERAVAAKARADLERDRKDAFQQTWKSAPLTMRLRFVRELLPEDHRLQNVLKEAAALEELRRRGRDLETWLNTYPSLFADAAHALESGVTNSTDDIDAVSTHATDIAAEQTLIEARSALESTLQALGIMWVAPAPGDAVTAEHEVIGEELSSLADGRIARLRRRGFRIQGRLALPAQVVRSAKPDPKAVAQPSSEASEIADTDVKTRAAAARNDGGDSLAKESAVPDAGGPDDLPDWLRMLGQRTFGCDLPSVLSLTEQITALSRLPAQIISETADDAARKVITDALHPLIPLLGLRYADGLLDIPEAWGAVFLEVRDPLLAWLNEKMNVHLLAPTRGAHFDSLTMEAVETRRTVHANENGTVAKVERIGLQWRERPITRAQVVLYATEGTS